MWLGDFFKIDKNFMKWKYNSCYGQNIDENDNLKNGLVLLLRFGRNIIIDNSSITCEVHYVIHIESQ